MLQVVGLGPLRNLTAWVSSSLLNFVGVNNTVLHNSFPIITTFGKNRINAAVIDLCVGDIELALLPAIILSTFDRSLLKRVVGSVAGVFLIVLINPIRIFTVMWIGSNFGWGLGELTHTFTFRLVLLLIILGFYYIWYLKYDDISNGMKRFIHEFREKIRR